MRLIDPQPRLCKFGCRLGAVLVLGLLLLSGCGRGEPTSASEPASETHAPTATNPFQNPETMTEIPDSTPPVEDHPTAVATAAGTGTEDAGTEDSGEVFTSERYGYSIVLPCCWHALPLPAATVDSALGGLGLDGFGLGEPEATAVVPSPSETAAQGGVGQILELLAILPREQDLGAPLAQLTVGVLPAVGLTLENYLDATAAELDRIANTRVISSQLDATYRRDEGLAAVIEYTAANLDENERVAGLQVTLLMPDADNFIVMTFTTATERFEELHPKFRRITRMVEL